MIPLSCAQLADQIESSTRLLLIDTRPNAQHCAQHVKASENVNFSNILLRRLLKGVVQLGSLLPSKELEQRLASRDSEREKLVLYDSCSKCDSVRTELLKHAQVLARTDLNKDSDTRVYFLDGKSKPRSFGGGLGHLDGIELCFDKLLSVLNRWT